MIHFHPLRVKKIQKESEDCVSISFEVPEELKNTFQFKQGQTLTFRKKINEEELRRNYSICSSPFDNELKVAVKKVEGGAFSTYVNEKLEEGDWVVGNGLIDSQFSDIDHLLTAKDLEEIKFDKPVFPRMMMATNV